MIQVPTAHNYIDLHVMHLVKNDEMTRMRAPRTILLVRFLYVDVCYGYQLIGVI